MKKTLLLTTLLAALATPATADTYYLDADMDTTDARNSPLIKELWFSQPGGTGTHPEKMTGNRFDVSGKAWRTPNTGGTSRFPGTLVVDAGGAGTGELMSGAWKPAGLDIQETALMRLRRPEVTLTPELVNIGEFGTMQFRAHSDDSKILYLEIGKLTGDGKLIFGTFQATDPDAEWHFTARDSTDFSGEVTVEYGTLILPSLLDLDDAVINIKTANDASMRLEGANLTVKDLQFNGSPYSAGTYQLPLKDDSGMTLIDGTGSITIPEPNP